MKTKKMTTLHLRKSIGPESIRGCLLIAVALACLTLSPPARAVLPSPTPGGGYPNFTTAAGDHALFSLTSGLANTAVGWYSLSTVTSGSYNTGVGAGALDLNNGFENTATGCAALLLNTGVDNTANGAFALVYNTSGVDNTAVGGRALQSNTIGSYNTAIGTFALVTNTSGNSNTAIGDLALSTNISSGNTAVGSSAAAFTTSGPDNTAIGQTALNANTGGNGNTAIGSHTLATSQGNHNTALGVNAGSGVTSANNVICIGDDVAGENTSDNRCFIGHIYENVQPIVGTDPDYVTVTSDGRLGRGNVSSRRYKHDIQPMDKTSEVLFGLKPVSFRYNKEYDATQTLAFGLIAEDVAGVDPDLVGRNPQGQPESVRYEQINAMLLNEFLKEHRKVEQQDRRMKEQDATITQLKSGMEVLTATVKEQASQIQKVSAQLELNKTAPRMVGNGQ
jgi:hypothetical protein